MKKDGWINADTYLRLYEEQEWLRRIYNGRVVESKKNWEEYKSTREYERGKRVK